MNTLSRPLCAEAVGVVPVLEVVDVPPPPSVLDRLPLPLPPPPDLDPLPPELMRLCAMGAMEVGMVEGAPGELPGPFDF